MDTHPFAKFGRDKYLLNIHTNRILKTVFQNFWVPFVILIFVALGTILVSIIMAGDLPSVIYITIRMFIGEHEYCNSSLVNAAACIIDLGGFVGLLLDGRSFNITERTFGITSPPFSIKIESPSPTSIK